MENVVKISFNSEVEMMKIENNNGTVFYGNYWDFSTEPEAIYKFLVKLGLPVKIKEDLPSIN